MAGIISFYEGRFKNDDGLSLERILDWDDDHLESSHTTIQWLFPLAVKSEHNHKAPVLSDFEVSQFREEPELRKNLFRSFLRFLSFFGLKLVSMGKGRFYITKTEEFEAKKGTWLYAGSHNFLRISRIIGSMSLLGYPTVAKAFCSCMIDIANENRDEITQENVNYWVEAAT